MKKSVVPMFLMLALLIGVTASAQIKIRVGDTTGEAHISVKVIDDITSHPMYETIWGTPEYAYVYQRHKFGGYVLIDEIELSGDGSSDDGTVYTGYKTVTYDITQGPLYVGYNPPDDLGYACRLYRGWSLTLHHWSYTG